MKNIGIVTTWLERGAAYVSRQYLDTLQKGSNVFIYARGGATYAKGDPDWDKPNVYWGSRNVPTGKMGINKRDFLFWIKKYDIEIIIFNEQQWWPPVVWCREMGILTGSYIDYYTEETIPMFACFDFLLCNSKRHYEAFKWHPQAIYIPWGTDTNLFKPVTGSIKKPDKFTFFHSAGCSPERKGTELILQAFKQLDIDAELIVHAQLDIGKKLGMEKLVDDLKKTKKLSIITETVPAPGLYYLGDVYLYPSRLDGLGLTLMEAQACGLPVITVDCPPMNEFVDESISYLVKVERYYARNDGYYWPMNIADVQDLAKAMELMYSRRNEIAELKEKTRQFAQSNLNWETNSACLLEKLEQVKKIDCDPQVIKNIIAYEKSGSLQHKFIVFAKAFALYFKNIIFSSIESLFR